MPYREDLENSLVEVRRRRDEAEAEAGRAAEELVRMAGGSASIMEVDPDAVRAAADTYAESVQRLKLLDDFARKLRRILI
mgnify:CR=1 FL=1|jgi:hypothetical protein